MAASRNDLCPCGSGRKYKKCCLGTPDPKAVRKSRVLLYGSLTLVVITAAVFLLAGQGVGAATGLASFGLVISYALAGGSGSTDTAPATAARAGKARAGGRAKR